MRDHDKRRKFQQLAKWYTFWDATKETGRTKEEHVKLSDDEIKKFAKQFLDTAETAPHGWTAVVTASRYIKSFQALNRVRIQRSERTLVIETVFGR